jgi:hypothetical protein
MLFNRSPSMRSKLFVSGSRLELFDRARDEILDQLRAAGRLPVPGAQGEGT